MLDLLVFLYFLVFLASGGADLFKDLLGFLDFLDFWFSAGLASSSIP